MPFFISMAAILTHITTIIIGILGLGFLIGFHELGHFLFCKLFNISTPSFSIGFGPQIFSKKIGSTLFSLSLIPFGGYVEIAGNAEIGQGEQLHTSKTDETSFAIKPYWQKLLVMLGGILFNLAFAYFAFILVLKIGAPKTTLISYNKIVPIIASIQPGSAAEKAGLIPHDHIIAIEGVSTNETIDPIKNALEKNSESPISIDVLRSNQTISLLITPDEITQGASSNRSLGITYDIKAIEPLSFTDSIVYGIKETHRWIKTTIDGFLHLKRAPKAALQGMAGPLMIISLMIKAAANNFMLFFIFLAVISINLAVLNLIPLPILDGGQVLFVTIEFIIRRQLPDTVRLVIHLITWVLFIALFVYLSYQDIVRIFGFKF